MYRHYNEIIIIQWNNYLLKQLFCETMILMSVIYEAWLKLLEKQNNEKIIIGEKNEIKWQSHYKFL